MTRWSWWLSEGNSAEKGHMGCHFWALSFVLKEFAFAGGGFFYDHLLGNERAWIYGLEGRLGDGGGWRIGRCEY